MSQSTPASGSNAQSRIAHVLGWALASVLVSVPLAIAPGFSIHFDVAPKVVLLCGGVGVAVLLWGFSANRTERLLGEGVGHMFLVLLAAQGLSLAVSTVFSAEPWISVAGSNWRRLGMVTHGGLLVFAFVTASWAAGNAERLVFLLRSITIAGAVAAFYAMLQYFGIDPLLAPAAYLEGEADWAIVRPPGTLGHAGYLATYLLYVAFLSLGLARIDRGRVWRGVGVVTAALSSAAVVLSGTRGAVLGLLLGLAVLWLWFRPRVGRQAILVGTAMAVGALGFYYSPAGQRLRNRFQWSAEDVYGGARLWLWRDSIHMGSAFWAAGAGPETFSSGFPQFQSVELARAYPNRYNESPHNVFLDVFTAQGVPGLLVFLGLIAVPFWAAARTGLEQRAVAGFSLAAFVAGLASNQFLVFTVPTALYFYFTASLLVALPLISDRGPAKRRLGRWVRRAATIPIGVVLLVFGVRLAAADRGMLRVRNHAVAGDIREAIAAYEDVVRIKPKGMNTDLQFSRLMAAAAKKTQDPAANLTAWLAAFEAARRATRATDAPLNAYYNLAAFHSMRNDFGRTETSLRDAIAAAPLWYKPHWMLAQVLREAGRLEEARAEAERAVELNGGKNPEVAATWGEIQRAHREKDKM